MAQITENMEINKTDNIHYDYEEITVERKKTITFSTENKKIKQIEILTYLQSLKLDKHIECFQTLMKDNIILYEITCKTEELKEEILSQRAVKPKTTNQPTLLLIQFSKRCVPEWFGDT